MFCDAETASTATIATAWGRLAGLRCGSVPSFQCPCKFPFPFRSCGLWHLAATCLASRQVTPNAENLPSPSVNCDKHHTPHRTRMDFYQEVTVPTYPRHKRQSPGPLRRKCLLAGHETSILVARTVWSGPLHAPHIHCECEIFDHDQVVKR